MHLLFIHLFYKHGLNTHPTRQPYTEEADRCFLQYSLARKAVCTGEGGWYPRILGASVPLGAESGYMSSKSPSARAPGILILGLVSPTAPALRVSHKLPAKP